MKDKGPDLFAHAERRAEAQAAKRAGMAKVDANANPEWKDVMYDVVQEVAGLHAEFNADDIDETFEALPVRPATPNKKALGPVMLRAARNGLCVKTDRVVPSRRAKLHGCPRQIWKSLIHGL
jgi:hypothetical protein